MTDRYSEDLVDIIIKPITSFKNKVNAKLAADARFARE